MKTDAYKQMRVVIISPYSRKLRNGKRNAKNYPYWQELVDLINQEQGIHIIQVGVGDEEKLKNIGEYKFDLSLKDLEKVVKHCNIWCSVDNFMNHLGWLHNKKGVVLFGQSDDLIFGHKENINLLKDRKHLRKFPFDIWEVIEHSNEVFVEPQIVKDKIIEELNNGHN